MFNLKCACIVVQNGSLSKVSPLFPKNYVNVVEASTASLPGKTLINTETNNFALKFGFAYRPWGNNTVVRGGFGIYFDVVPREASISSVPFLVNEQPYDNPRVNSLVTLPRVFSAAGGAGPSSFSLPIAVNPNIQMPYSMQYSLTVEHSR